MIGVIAALPEEAAVIAGAMRESRVSRSAGVAVTCGIIGGREVVLAQSGVGKVNAALCAQALISVYAVDCVINAGVAGGARQAARHGPAGGCQRLRAVRCGCDGGGL